MTPAEENDGPLLMTSVKRARDAGTRQSSAGAARQVVASTYSEWTPSRQRA